MWGFVSLYLNMFYNSMSLLPRYIRLSIKTFISFSKDFPSGSFDLCLGFEFCLCVLTGHLYEWLIYKALQCTVSNSSSSKMLTHPMYMLCPICNQSLDQLQIINKNINNKITEEIMRSIYTPRLNRQFLNR